MATIQRSLLLALLMMTSPIVGSVTKTFTTCTGLQYVYDYAPAEGTKPTFLLIHGYPSSRGDWKHQFDDLSAAGFGVIAPDCLGYGDSDKPTNIEAYNLKKIAGHLVGILDQEGLTSVIGTGHDWGTNVLSRTAVWYPQRFQKLAFLSVGYSAPGTFLDIDAWNALGLKELGYMQFGYWYFFNSYIAASLISDRLESYFHLAFHTNASAWAENLASLGTARAWLAANTTTTLPSWLTEEDKENWIRIYSQKDTVVASLNYYQALMRGIQADDEAVISDQDRLLNVPVLAIGGTKDLVTRADQLRMQTEPYTTQGYTERWVDAGHWLMIEQRENVSSILIEFAGM